MATTSKSWNSSKENIEVAVEMIFTGKKLKDVAAVFEVSINTLYGALRKCYLVVDPSEVVSEGRKKRYLTVALIKEQAALKKKIRISISPGGNDAKGTTCKLSPTIHTHLVVILQELEKGHTLQEIGGTVGVSRQRVHQILRSSGQSTHNPSSDIQEKKETSEALLHREFMQKRKAFRAGLSLAGYNAMLSAAGSSRMSQLALIERNIEGNKTRLAVMPAEKMCQLSALEIFEAYARAAQKLFPTLPRLESFDRIMEKRFEYRITRIDTSLPFISGNVEIVTVKEFGSRLARNYGIHSPTNPLYRRTQKNT